MKSIFTLLVFSLFLFSARSENSDEPKSIMIYVSGAIKKTGGYSVAESMAFVAAITSAGGLGDFADARNIKVLRPVVSTDNKEVTMKLVTTVDYKAIIAGEKSGPVLQSGDVISIPMRINKFEDPPVKGQTPPPANK